MQYKKTNLELRQLQEIGLNNIRPIEDGNISPNGNVNESGIITSDYIDFDYYYENFGSKYQTEIQNLDKLKSDGSLWLFTIILKFDKSTPTSMGGVYGDNIIHKGDRFVVRKPNNMMSLSILTNDFVTGYISEITTTINENPSTIILTLDLKCVITDGTPENIDYSDTFIWRRLFYDNNEYKQPPINLSVNYTSSTTRLFRWEDSDKNAVKYVLKIRSSNTRKLDETSGPTPMVLYFPTNNREMTIDYSTGVYSYLANETIDWIMSVSSIYNEDDKTYSNWSNGIKFRW